MNFNGSYPFGSINYRLWLENLGDVDGDGGDELALNVNEPVDYSTLILKTKSMKIYKEENTASDRSPAVRLDKKSPLGIHQAYAGPTGEAFIGAGLNCGNAAVSEQPSVTAPGEGNVNMSLSVPEGCFVAGGKYAAVIETNPNKPVILISSKGGTSHGVPLSEILGDPAESNCKIYPSTESFTLQQAVSVSFDDSNELGTGIAVIKGSISDLDGEKEKSVFMQALTLESLFPFPITGPFGNKFSCSPHVIGTIKQN